MSRTPVADFFGTKKRAAGFDFAGIDAVVDGRFNGTEKRYVLNVTKPVLSKAGDEVTFSPVFALNTSSAGQLDGLVDDVLARTQEGKLMAGDKAGKVEDAVIVFDAYAPQAAAALKRAKAKAGGVADAPAPAKAAAAPAPAADADAPAPKKGPKPPPKPAAPNSRRRLLQGGGCGICEFQNKAGKCVDAPSDCDGTDGLSGEFNCGQCSYFTWDDSLGHCETASNC